MAEEQTGITRRRALQILGAGGILSLAGCATVADTIPDDGRGLDGSQSSVTPRDPPTGPPDETYELTAAATSEKPTNGSSVPMFQYDETFPGPELRASEGDVVAVTLDNQLSTSSTIHWHGLPVANAMDGVPNITQDPVSSGSAFTYRFRADPPGTYFYHSHAGLQLDQGLAGPLIVEEDNAHVEYDAEYVVVLDDFLAGEPDPPDRGSTGDGSRRGGGMGGMMNLFRPPYRGMVMNGQLGANPPVFDVTEGDRVRLRFINASSATMFQVRTAGHQFDISHADGRPVEPVTVDSFTFSPGERYDAILSADTPGVWELLAAPVRGSEPSASGILQYESAADQSPTRPETWGRTLSYDDLVALEPLEGLDGSPDRTFDLTLSPGGDGYSWAIDGQVFPDADPLDIVEGEHVRIRMQNRSPFTHPMHLHGHFFQVGDAVKDTVRVPGRMGSATIDFYADNPGNWFFHCHNLYHLEAGMARVIRYV